MFIEKLFLKISQNSLENTCGDAPLIKVAGRKPATLLKKRLQHRFFPVNFKIFNNTILQNTYGQLTAFAYGTNNIQQNLAL